MQTLVNTFAVVFFVTVGGLMALFSVCCLKAFYKSRKASRAFDKKIKADRLAGVGKKKYLPVTFKPKSYPSAIEKDLASGKEFKPSYTSSFDVLAMEDELKKLRKAKLAGLTPQE